jgi:hypothetical protein
MSENIKSCASCKFALHDDWGYSNYTVEGTSFHYLKSLHPAGSFDEFYGEDERMKFADQCASYIKGEGVFIDCDREASGENGDLSPYSDDPEIKQLLKNF